MFIIKDKAAWEVSDLQENGTFVVKSKTEGSPVELTVYPNGKTDKFNPAEEDIYKDEVVVRFDDHAFTPAAFRCRPERKTNAILAAINFDTPEGFKIVNITNDGVQVLGNHVTSTHAEFIGNFGVTKKITGKNGQVRRDNSSIMFITVSDKDKKVETYRFRYNIKEKTVVMECRRSNISDIPAKGKPGHIRTNDFVGKCIQQEMAPLQNFYPSSPTNLIICHPMDIEDLTNTINERKYWRAPRDYEIVQEYSEDKLKKLVEEGFRAVCIYIPMELSMETQREMQRSKNGDAIKDGISGKSVAEIVRIIKDAGFKFIFFISSNGFISRWVVEGKEQFSLNI